MKQEVTPLYVLSLRFDNFFKTHLFDRFFMIFMLHFNPLNEDVLATVQCKIRQKRMQGPRDVHGESVHLR